MALDDDIAVLSQAPLFNLLERDALRLVAFASESRSYREGDVLFKRGDRSDGGYVVSRGTVALDAREDGAPEAFLAGPGSLIGQAALFARVERRATATAREPSSIIRVTPSLMRRVLEEFPDAAAKQPPNKFNYASTGVGSLNHLAPEELKRLSKVELLHVPYGGGGPAIQAVVGGQANMTWLSFAALRGQIQAGKIKPLAVAGDKRLPELPNVPTVAESGFPGFVAYSWSGMFAPKGTPEATVKKLTADFQAVLADPEIKKKISMNRYAGK